MSAPSLLSGRLGAFVAGLSLDVVPQDVLDVARCALLHNLSVAAAGGAVVAVGEDWARSRAVPAGAGARTLLSGVELSPSDAAFANGCLIHARAQDDTYFPGLTHVGAATTPAVLALAEQRGATLGDVVLGIVAGYEVAAALGVAGAKISTARGFRASGIYGPFGASAGSAKILGLDAPRAAHAIAIASSFSAGTNQTWVGGSSEWQLQLGNAARSGLEAATLASFGATGSVDAFEGADGFYAAYVGDAGVAGRLGHDLGEAWRTRDVTFKAHPVCAILQAPVDAANRLHAESSGVHLAAATLKLSPAEAAYPGTDGRPPFSDPGAALMSAPYCLGLALGQGRVTADDLNRSGEAETQDLSHRVRVIADPDLGPREFVLEVQWDDGRHTTSTHPDDQPGRWTRDQLAGYVVQLQPEAPEVNLAAVSDAIWSDLDHPVSDLIDAMAARRPARSTG